jgi:hypothetical protein
VARKRENTTGIPDFELDSMARALLPIVRKLFEKEETRQEFEIWKAEREKKMKNSTKENT